MDIFLVVLAVLVPLMLVAVNFYVLVYFQHPEDKNSAYFPKFLVVLGLSLAMGVVCLIPLDVANQEGVLGCGSWNTECGGLSELKWVWQIAYLIIASLVVVVIPFAIFYYEAYDADYGVCHQLISATQWELATLVISAVTLGVMFGLLGTTEIPVESYNFVMDGNSSANPEGFYTLCSSTQDGGAADSYLKYGLQGVALSAGYVGLEPACGGGTNPAGDHVESAFTVTPSAAATLPVWSASNSSVLAHSWASFPFSVVDHGKELLNIQVTFLVYLICLMGFLGWFFFVLYAGIGLVALPMDLIRSFMYRPRYMPADLYAVAVQDVSKRVTELLEIGAAITKDEATAKHRQMGRRERMALKREQKETFNQFKQAVIMLEEDHQDLNLCHKEWNTYNPLVPFGKLVFGVCSVLLTLAWLLHIVLYMLIRDPYPHGTPTSYFLNVYLEWGSKEIKFELYGTLSVLMFSMYLLFCVMKGNFKFGMRFFIFELHPMKVGETYMSSFLANCSLILMTTPALVMFCTFAFADYVVLTDVDTIFGQQCKHMRFFRYFFDNNIFIFALLAFFVLAGVFLACFPNDKDIKTAKMLKKKIRKFKNAHPNAGGVNTTDALEAKTRKKAAKASAVTGGGFEMTEI